MSTAARTLKTSDAFLHLPVSPSPSIVPTIVFFITGNPGLISYYHEFLTLLCQAPTTGSTAPSASSSTSHTDPEPESNPSPHENDTINPVIAGFSLGGFELEDLPTPSSNPLSPDKPSTDQQLLQHLAFPPSSQRRQIYSLREQIALCLARLDAVTAHVRSFYRPEHTVPAPPAAGVNVVLIGHSVGAYIALELVRLHHARTSSSSSSSSTSSGSASFDIISAVLLTPTIVDIARSASGRVAGPLLGYMPFLPGVAQTACWGLTGLLSRERVRWLVGRVTGMGVGCGLDATTGFLGRGGCVRQALFLARDEMREIGADGWGEEVWGVVTGEDGEEGRGRRWRAPKLYFWFAGRDHWVADRTREGIVGRLKGEGGVGVEKISEWSRYGGPEIVVDEDEGLVHAWCIEQSVMVAKRVKMWIEESLELKRDVMK